MILELNIFHLIDKHKLAEDDMQGSEEVCSIGSSVWEPKAHSLQAKLVQKNEAIGGELAALVTPAAPMFSPASPSEKKFNMKEPSMKAATHAIARVKELLLLDPP